MHKFDLPVMLVQGGKDRIVEAEGAFEFMAKSASTDKQLVFYPDLWHDVVHEPELWSIMRRANAWLDARSKNRQGKVEGEGIIKTYNLGDSL